MSVFEKKKYRDIILCYVLIHLKTNILFSFSYEHSDSKDPEQYILGHLNNEYHVGMIVNSKFKKIAIARLAHPIQKQKAILVYLHCLISG